MWSPSGGRKMRCCFQACQGSQMTAYLCLLESSAQGASFRRPSRVDLDVEPYLSWPQVNTHTPGSAENVSYVSDLLQLPKWKDASASFCNVNEQLLFGEAVVPPSHLVSHWPRETNSKIRASENVKVLKQHKGSLQAHHKGMVGSEIFFYRSK